MYSAAVLFSCVSVGKVVCVSPCLQDMSAGVPQHERCCSSGAHCSLEYVTVLALCTIGLAVCLCTSYCGHLVTPW